MSRFVCHCGFLGQSGVKVPKAKKTLKPSIRYRPTLSLVVGNEQIGLLVGQLQGYFYSSSSKALFIEQPAMALGKWVLIFINFLTQLVSFFFFELQKAILAVTGADSITLKEKYLDWAYRSSGYKKARAVFKRYSQIDVHSCTSFSTPHAAPHYLDYMYHKQYLRK